MTSEETKEGALMLDEYWGYVQAHRISDAVRFQM
jgi:hypothetical protein